MVMKSFLSLQFRTIAKLAKFAQTGAKSDILKIAYMSQIEDTVVVSCI